MAAKMPMTSPATAPLLKPPLPVFVASATVVTVWTMTVPALVTVWTEVMVVCWFCLLVFEGVVLSLSSVLDVDVVFAVVVFKVEEVVSDDFVLVSDVEVDKSEEEVVVTESCTVSVLVSMRTVVWMSVETRIV